MENCFECNPKRANVGGPLDLRLAGALQLFTVTNVSCYTGLQGVAWDLNRIRGTVIHVLTIFHSFLANHFQRLWLRAL
jgi:hypothetical protein